jgi:hypothetical protein
MFDTLYDGTSIENYNLRVDIGENIFSKLIIKKMKCHLKPSQEEGKSQLDSYEVKFEILIIY